jgi:hypothetical protein
MFGGSKPAPKPAPKPTPAPVAAPAPKKPAFSLFGGAAKPKAVAPAKKAPVKKTPVAAKKTVAKKAPVKKIPVKKAPVKDSNPVLSRWTQNADGSITGVISNSNNFKNGTKITTSPVRKGAKAGAVITTGSGSKYKLS